MILDRHVADFAKLRAVLTIPIAPLQYVVSWPVHFIDEIKNRMSSHQALVEENLRLQAEQLLLNAQLQRLLMIESENSHLKALLQSSAQIKEKVLIAQLLAVDTEPFTNQVILNKGSSDGVYVGQAVLDATGVVGQVIGLSLFTSRVLLITDIHSGVSVSNSRNGVRFIVTGDGYAGRLRLLYVSHTDDIKVGDIIVTSGLSKHYPEGYPVGKVISVAKDSSQPFATVLIQPAAHLESSREVLLVWYKQHA